MAAVAAIFDARFPSFDGEKVDYKKKTDEKVPITKVPVAITVLKIGNAFVVDPSEPEEQALDARLTVTTIDDGKLCSLQKGGLGTLSVEDIEKMIDLALVKGAEIRKLIKQE
jgi:exosome complex component RRP42